MKRSVMHKASLREIKVSLGRYLAILSIIALGVGFFSGVRITTKAMVKTVGSFINSHDLFDYRLLSTVAWDSDDVEFFREQPDVKYAEGAYNTELICDYEGAKENVLKIHSLTENVNTLQLTEGRLPQRQDECVCDAKMSNLPPIGSKVLISSENDPSSASELVYKEYTVVGIAYSSYYVNFERGTTSIGNGSISGFIYIMPEAFNMLYYSEIFVRFDQDNEIYSDDYKNYIKAHDEYWQDIVQQRAEIRYDNVYKGKGKLLGIPEPESYVLGRNNNIGYACFENDSQIVAQVAKVFPVFFILVAALVCMTTMGRMVEEQRTQIGIFKALGYSEAAIMGRFAFYSGSAAVIGTLIGYTVGIILFPSVIWTTYKLMYIPLPIKLVFDIKLALLTLSTAMICSLGTTWISCRYELKENAASLMRPKSPKAGKRVFLERIPFIWNRMKFLYKVSVRNIFRYKKRFFMMILGISGCTALLLTGLGLKDSIAGFADMQYGEIQLSDAQVIIKNNDDGSVPESLISTLDSCCEDYTFINESSWELLYDDKVKSISLMTAKDTDAITDFFSFHTLDGETINYPRKGEAIVCNSISERYNINEGDVITLRDADMRTLELTVTGIFENHVYNYIYISPDTISSQLGEAATYNGAYMKFPEGSDNYRLLADIAKDRSVTGSVLFEQLKDRLSNMMNSMDYIVLVVILSAAGLAFIVIYDLTNINITERLREIATIKVLGFYRHETSAYVLRENIALTAVGSAFGLGLGVLLHRFVMKQIIVDMVSFRVHISPFSFLLSVILTFVFNFIVELFMWRKLDNINMAESLKSVE